ncbi:MAG: T9SS type A sorting domain-containing protein [Bacteroidota bacterium]
MKKNLLSIIMFFVVTMMGSAYSQCPCTSDGTQFPLGIMTPASSWQTATTCQYGGEYGLYYVTYGYTYQWSYCAADGGSATWDTQLSLYDNSTLACLTFNDDYCGNQSKIIWTANFSGVVRVKTNQYNCTTNSTCATLVYMGSNGTGCTNWYTSPASANYSWPANSGYFTVYATGSCSMTASSSVSWINNITYSSGGYNYSIDANYACSSRTGVINIYDASNNNWVTSFQVTQDGDYSTCTGWYISPTSGSYSSSSNSGFFNVYASGGTCGYHVTPSDSWIAITYNSGELDFNIDPNPDCMTRTGYIYVYVTCTNALVATYAITQAGSGSLPGAANVSGPSPICQGSSQTYFCSSSGATSYNWTLPPGWSGSSSTSSITVTVGSNSGYICCTPVNACGSGTQVCFPVAVTGIPFCNNIAGNASVCPGTTQSYSTNGNTTVYNWTLPPGWTGSSSNGSITVTVGSNSGNICCTPINGCGPGTQVCFVATVTGIPPVPTITVNGTTLMSSAGTTYQWYLNGTLIPGATTQFYTCGGSGFYQVEITNDYGCAAISTPIGCPNAIEEHISGNIMIYPNPTDGIFTLEMRGQGLGKTDYKIEIFNYLGQNIYHQEILMKKTEINLSNMPKGIYFVQISTEEITYISKVVLQ